MNTENPPCSSDLRATKAELDSLSDLVLIGALWALTQELNAEFGGYYKYMGAGELAERLRYTIPFGVLSTLNLPRSSDGRLDSKRDTLDVAELDDVAAGYRQTEACLAELVNNLRHLFSNTKLSAQDVQDSRHDDSSTGDEGAATPSDPSVEGAASGTGSDSSPCPTCGQGGAS